MSEGLQAGVDIKPGRPPKSERERLKRVEARAAAQAFVFSMLSKAAAAGARCPTGSEIRTALRKNGLPIGGEFAEHFTTLLAREGKIEIAVSGRNWRTVRVLKGEAAGRATQADPSGGTPRLVMGKTNRYPSRFR